MNLSEAVVRPPNSILLVGDRSGEPPRSLGGGSVAATDSCIVLGILSSQDGVTKVRIAEGPDDHPAQLAFEGAVKLESGILAVFDAYGRTILERPVAGRTARIQIWVNDSTEPDEVSVVVRP